MEEINKEELIIDKELFNKEIEQFEIDHHIFDDRIEKFNKSLYESEWFKSRPEKIKKAYLSHPFYKFYKLKSCNKPVRIYGFNEEISELGLITALTLIPSENEPYVCTKNFMLDSFEKLDKWSEDDLALIKLYEQYTENLHFILAHPFGYENIIQSDYK